MASPSRDDEQRALPSHFDRVERCLESLLSDRASALKHNLHSSTHKLIHAQEFPPKKRGGDVRSETTSRILPELSQSLQSEGAKRPNGLDEACRGGAMEQRKTNTLPLLFSLSP